MFSSSYDWFIVLFVSIVIGQSDFQGFGFTKLISVKTVRRPSSQNVSFSAKFYKKVQKLFLIFAPAS